MATRFYLSSTATVTVTPSYAAWDRTSEADRRKMLPAKDASAMTNKTCWANTNPTANQTCLNRQYISDPMVAGIAFTAGDTVKVQVRCRESATNDNINRQPICIKVVSEDGNTIRATLLALAHYGPNTTEWPTTLTNKTAADGDAITASYTTVAGDRLVIEIGGQVSSAGGTTVTGTQSFGADNATDLGENETDTLAYNPWFEISRTIYFLQYIQPSGVSSAEAFGTPIVISLQIISNAGAIASQEAFGTAKLILYLSPTGIVSTETFGIAKLIVSLSPSGIASLETFGTSKLILYLSPSGIASAETFGNPTVISGAQFIQPPGIASAEAFGTAKLNLSLLPSAIISEEAFGNILQLSFRLYGQGIASLEAFGLTKLILYLIASGIASTEAFGNPKVNFLLQPSGIPSQEILGLPKLNLVVIPAGIGSAETFGSPKLNLTLVPDTIASAEVFGLPKLVLYILASGIVSEEAFGSATVTISQVILPSGIASLEGIGSHEVILWAHITQKQWDELLAKVIAAHYKV